MTNASIVMAAGDSGVGDWAVPLAIVIGLTAYFGVGAAAIVGSVDAARRPDVVWLSAGYRKSRWVWQAVGVIALPVALIYSGVYFLRIRPRLSAAERALGRDPRDDSTWTGDRHWYNTWQRARRSPTQWAIRARRWWIHALAVPISALLALQEFLLATSGFERHSSSRLFFYALAAFFILNVPLAAGQAGFWYAEHMRLTGRRPVLGGPLLGRRLPPNA